DLLDQGVTLFEDAFTKHAQQFIIWRIERAAQAEAHAATLWIDADDAEQEFLALAHDLLRMLNPLVGKLGDVDQSFNAILDASKGAEVGQLGHVTANKLADLVGTGHAAPGLGLGALDREGDLLFL